MALILFYFFPSEKEVYRRQNKYISYYYQILTFLFVFNRNMENKERRTKLYLHRKYNINDNLSFRGTLNSCVVFFT